MDGRQRRLLFLILSSLSVLLLAACTPAASLVEEPCPTPTNLPLEDEPSAAALPATLVTGIPVPAAPEAPLPEKPVTATPKALAAPEVTAAAPPVAAMTEDAPSEAAPVATVTQDAPPEPVPAVVTGPPPVIVSTTPGDTAGVTWDQDIRILFSTPMDRVATEQAISVTGIEYTVSWYRDDKLIRLVPIELLVEYQWYEVSIGAAAATVGGAPLGVDYSFAFWGEEP